MLVCGGSLVSEFSYEFVMVLLLAWIAVTVTWQLMWLSLRFG